MRELPAALPSGDGRDLRLRSLTDTALQHQLVSGPGPIQGPKIAGDDAPIARTARDLHAFDAGSYADGAGLVAGTRFEPVTFGL